MAGVTWGHPYEVPSVAYWAMLARRDGSDDEFAPRRVGRALVEQVVFCILGGYGMPAELGIHAFANLLERGYLERPVPAETIEAVLREPLEIQGRQRHYRFAAQKARYIAAAQRALFGTDLPHEALELRDWLRTLPGIGYKTASWIVRDWCNSDAVAILDIHIERACRALGVFDEKMRVSRDYLEMEARFLLLANAMEVRPSVLDNLMWAAMRVDGAILSGGTAI